MRGSLSKKYRGVFLQLIIFFLLIHLAVLFIFFLVSVWVDY